MAAEEVGGRQTVGTAVVSVEVPETSAPEKHAETFSETQNPATTVTSLSRNHGTENPLDEIGTDGTVDGLRAAVEALTGPDRDPRFNAAKTLVRSEAFWAAVEPLKRDLLARVQADLGGPDDVAVTAQGLQDAYCEARLFRQSMFLRLVDVGGPITHKGRQRALYRAYLDALDRETKLAQVCGLERKARDITRMSPAEYARLQSGGGHP